MSSTADVQRLPSLPHTDRVTQTRVVLSEWVGVLVVVSLVVKLSVPLPLDDRTSLLEVWVVERLDVLESVEPPVSVWLSVSVATV